MKTKDSLDESLAELGVDITENTPDTGLPPRFYTFNDAQLNAFLLQAIIKEYNSLVEELEERLRKLTSMESPVYPNEISGAIEEIKFQITSLKQKIINLESKLK